MCWIYCCRKLHSSHVRRIETGTCHTVAPVYSIMSQLCVTFENGIHLLTILMFPIILSFRNVVYVLDLVALVLGGPSIVKQIILAANGLGMCNGSYAFFAFDPFGDYSIKNPEMVIPHGSSRVNIQVTSWKCLISLSRRLQVNVFLWRHSNAWLTLYEELFLCFETQNPENLLLRETEKDYLGQGCTIFLWHSSKTEDLVYSINDICCAYQSFSMDSDRKINAPFYK